MAIINGTAGDDVLVGTADDDELFGFAGRDDLTGGAGNDLLDGGTGRDTMAGGLGDDVYVVNHDKDAVTESGGEGTDEVQSLRTYTLPEHVEHLTLTGAGNIEGTGNTLDNTIIGSAGNNNLNGRAGADDLRGGDGNDTYVVDNAGDQVTEVSGEGEDTVRSQVSFVLGDHLENLILTGNQAVDGTGNAVANELTGNNQSNTLDGGGGADTLKGRKGDDTYVLDDAGDVVIELASQGEDTVQSALSHTLGEHVEDLVLTGLGDIDGTGNALVNELMGNAGANKLVGRGGGDTLDGGAGADDMRGGGGDDTYVVDNAGDVVTENANKGRDTVRSSVSYELGEHVEKLVLTGGGDTDGTGNALDNTLRGNAGANVLDGMGGVDSMRGLGGDDTYVVDDRDDEVVENSGEGTDAVQSLRTYTLPEHVEHLTLTGAGNIKGTGNTLDNVLSGNSGDNTLKGRGGDDVLDGGSGVDILLGAAGDDVLVWDPDDAQLSGGGGTDTVRLDGAGEIADFTATPDISRIERVDLTGAGDNTLIVDRDALLHFTSGDTLRADGDAGDAVEAEGIWQDNGQVSIGSETYDEYLRGRVTLQVHEDVDQSAILVGSIGLAAVSFDLADIDGDNGFRIQGLGDFDRSGWSVSIEGDINGDGFDDVVVGAPFANPAAGGNAGTTYVVFGTDAMLAGGDVDLSSLDGTNGFRIDGASAGDQSGFFVSNAGDFNNDGFDDLIIGAPRADPGGDNNAGESFLVFGKGAGFAATLDLGNLNGDGFRIDGIDAADRSGTSVAGGGDVNGDDFDDLIIGAPYADRAGNTNAGEAYVLFGKGAGFGTVDLANLDGDGVLLHATSGYAGFSVGHAGDVNGDGFDDIIVGADRAYAPGANNAGITYVVFGRENFANKLNLENLNGQNGFRIEGIDFGNRSGYSVDSAGDVNGDGFADLLIGARYGRENLFDAGQAFVVFGKASGFNKTLKLSKLDGDDGFAIDGVASSDLAGTAVAAAGDVNGDGFDDVLVGAPNAEPSGQGYAGETYVVFGKASGFDKRIKLADLDGSDGVRLEGVDPQDFSGSAVSGGGDVNGDHYDDLIIGAPRANPGGGIPEGGESYVLFGGDIFEPGGGPPGGGGPPAVTIEVGLGTLLGGGGGDGSLGFAINGIDLFDESGWTVSDAGDVNRDGLDDVIIGTRSDAFFGRDAREAYVVFGRDGGFPAEIELSSFLAANGGDGSLGFVIDLRNVPLQDGVISRPVEVSGAGDTNGDGAADLLIGYDAAAVDDEQVGQAFIVYGQTAGFAAELDLASLLAANGGDGSAGFVLNGPGPAGEVGLGSRLGDVDGDGLDDLLVHNQILSGPDPEHTYVVLGRSTTAAELDLRDLLAANGGDGSLGFALPELVNSSNQNGWAGDVNGDGFDDIVIGEYTATPNGNNSGETYVVFGTDQGFDPEAEFTALDGSNGFRVRGINADDRSGSTVSGAGDVNGDGIDDLIIGASGADPNGLFSGQTYVVFGQPGAFPADFELSSLLAVNGGDGSAGFALNGVSAGDQSGSSVSGAGDVNADGYDDLIISSRFVDAPGGGGLGQSYLVFGSGAGFPAEFELSSLLSANDGDGSLRFVINNRPTLSGGGKFNDVSPAGDVNGDGFDDLLLGSAGSDPDAGRNAGGQTFVYFGRDFRDEINFEGGAGNETLNGTAADEILVGGHGDDTLDGAGGEDVQRGGAGDDTLVYDAADRKIDGGTGEDTLRVDGSGVILDLSNIPDTRITSIEKIDLTGSGDNTLGLTLLDLLNLSESSNQLLVDGDAGDTVNSVGEGWTLDAGGPVDIGGTLYNSFSLGVAMLLVDTDVTTNIT